MTDTETPEVAPAFTTEQRLAIRELQVKMLTLQSQARQLQDQSDQLSRYIVNQINQSAAELKVDSTKYSLDIDKLAFVPIK